MIEIKINNLNNLLKLTNQFPQVAEKHVNKAIFDSLNLVKNVVASKAPRGVSGDLRNQWKIEMSRFSGSLVSTAQSDGYNYGLAVEKGTAPHFPPVSKIAPWAVKRGLNPWAVAKSIAKKGTKANPFLKNSANYSKKGIENILEKSIGAIINDVKTL